MATEETIGAIAELLPCPFCGNRHIVAGYLLVAGDAEWFCACQGCGAEVNGWVARPYAVEAWNRRGAQQ